MILFSGGIILTIFFFFLGVWVIQIVSICATLGEDPIIRYHRPLDEDTGAPINKSLPYKLAMTVQREIDNFCRINPNFPVRRLPRGI